MGMLYCVAALRESCDTSRACPWMVSRYGVSPARSAAMGENDMKKAILAAMATFAVCAAPAFADGTTDAYNANTVVATGANGAVLKFHFNADGGYVMKAGDQAVPGRWAVEGAQFCLTPQGGEKSCSAHAPNRKIGDTWSVTGADGVQYSVTLTAGR
jgi:hypothetical protein